MSVCLCSFRALTRSRTPNPKTLAPFLYQTATIQQRYSVSRRSASNSSNPSRPEHDVPFEDEKLPPAVDEAKSSRQTTITGSERAAFETLYKKFNNADQKSLNEHELDQIADEYYEDDDDNAKDNMPEDLDSLFDTVLAGQTPPRPFDQKNKSIGLENLAKQVLQPEQDSRRKKLKEEAAKKQADIKKLRREEKDRVKSLLEAAPTDQALWAVLEKEVFSVIRSLELDQNNPGASNGKLKPKAIARNRSKSSRSTKLSPSDPTIVFPNYPSHLSTAAKTLRSRFPASPLLFNIVPRVKELGRSSYALGASTNLYKVIIIAAFRQNHSYSQICSLLQDMDNGGIEYDYDVVTILDEVLKTHTDALRGSYGKGIQTAMYMDLHSDGIKQLQAWSSAVKQRVGYFGDERMRAGHTIRRTVTNRPTKYRGPLDRIWTPREKVGAGKVEGGRGRGRSQDNIPFVDERAAGTEISAKGDSALEPEVLFGTDGFLGDAVEAPVESVSAEPGADASVPPVQAASAAGEEVLPSASTSTSTATSTSTSTPTEEKDDEKRNV